MRMIIAAILAMTVSAAVADELDDAHRLAISGRDSYWNCLAREYSQDGNKSLSEQDFTRRVRSMSGVTERDWYTWHHDYDEPGTARAPAPASRVRLGRPPDRVAAPGSRSTRRSGSAS